MTLHAYRKVGGVAVPAPIGATPAAVAPLVIATHPLLGGLTAHKIGQKWRCSVQPEDLIDTTQITRTYYVDGVNGVNANSGLSWANRKKSIKAALNAAVASGEPSRVLVYDTGAPYYRQISAGGDDGVLLAATAPILLESMNGRIQSGTFDNLAWTKTAGSTYTYQATRSNAIGVRNASIQTRAGLHVAYTWAASSAAVDATEGSWFTDGATVWVHPHGHDVPDLNRARVYLTGAAGLQWENNSNLLVRGFDFEGGVNGAIKISNGSTNIVVAEDCTFRYAAKSNPFTGGVTVQDGVSVLDAGFVAAFNCRADANSKDGFNFHANNGIAPTALLVDCIGTLNGLSPSVSNNGFTTHDGVKSIAIGCDWRGNFGTGSGHVNDGTVVWEVGGISGASMGDVIFGGGIAFAGYGVWTGAAEMWLQDCRDVGAEVGVNAEGGATVHLRDHRGSGRRLGAIDAY